MQYCDLHIHTNASDGSDTPAEVVTKAKELGLAAVAITDHDTADGVAEALSAGAAQGLEVVPGIEVSVEYQGYGVHILGYYIDPASPALGRLLDWAMEERRRRNREMAAAMQADGIPIYFEELEARNPNTVIGRPHFAAALVELGLATTPRDAFLRYLEEGEIYFRKREYIPLEEGMQVILDAGGKPVFAHPFQYQMEEPALWALAEKLRDAGAVGIECTYTGYTAEQTAYLQSMAEKLHLCVTGGSDYHGKRKAIPQLGVPQVPYDYLEALKAI